VQVSVGHGHRKGVRRRGSPDIYLYMYTKDGGEVSLEGVRHCGVVWLQPQRQLSKCAAALELTSSSRTARLGSGSTRTAQQLSSCRKRGESEPRGRMSLRRRVAPTAKAALELRSSSRTDQQLSNCTARAGQHSTCAVALDLQRPGSGSSQTARQGRTRKCAWRVHV